jgi:Phage tail tube protein
MSFSAIPVPETQVGIALEVTRGTPVAPAYWLPVMSPKYKPDLQLLPDEGLRGSMVTLYDEVPGLRFDGHAWDSYPYMDTLPVLIRALLGSKDTKTTAPTTTELFVEAKAAATKIITVAEIAEGSYVVIGSGVGTSETHLTGKPKEIKAGEWEIPLTYPLAFTYAAKTAVTGLTKHAFSLLNNSPTTGNQPPSCTLTDYAGEEHWRQLPAAQLSSINLTGAADALPKIAVDWMANAAITPSEPSASYSTAEAPPGWTVTAAVGGTQIGYLVSWECDLKRNVKNVPAITGTQNYFQHFAGALDATAKIVVLENPEATWLSAYEKGELESLDLTLSDVQNGWAMNLHSTKAKFTTGELDRSKEWVEVPLDMQLIPSATDALAGGVSPITVTIGNAHTAEY